MSLTAIIGGSGLTELKNLQIAHKEKMDTPFGAPSAALVFGKVADTDVVFLARHGEQHTIPPHKINYQANIWALRESGATQVIAVAAVGGISAAMKPEQLVIPSQIIDYTYARGHTFFEDDFTPAAHIDFTQPYAENLRARLITGCKQLKFNIITEAVYAATQGPRLESAAEVLKLERDGCDIVGMTGMPEAALAKELRLEYACCALVVNWAAGKAVQKTIDMLEMEECMASGMLKISQILESVLRNY